MAWLYLILALSLGGLFYSGWRWWSQTSSPLARRQAMRLEMPASTDTSDDEAMAHNLALERLRPADAFRLDVVLAPLIWQAGLQERRARHYLMLHGYLCSVLAVALALAQGFNMVFVGGMLLVIVLPPAAVVWLAQRHRRRIEAQLPRLIDDMVSALRAGHTLCTMWPSLVSNTQAPMREALVELNQRLRFGDSLDLALQSWAMKTTSADLRFFIAALRIQHQSGANPIEVLGVQAHLMREKLEMQQSMRAATSEARLSAWILALLPVLVAAVLAMVSPERLGLLWTDPRGEWLLRASVLFETAGVLWLWFLLRSRT